MPTPAVAEVELAPVLKALAEPLRRRIVEALATEALCVCHLVEETGASQSLVSHHLRTLRDAGVVEPERFRQWTYYRLRADTVHALAAYAAGLAAAAPGPGERRRPCW